MKGTREARPRADAVYLCIFMHCFSLEIAKRLAASKQLQRKNCVLYELHKKWTDFLAVCAGGSGLKKRVLFVTMLTTSEHRSRCDWIVTVLAGKTKFLAAGLKKGFPAV